MTDVTIAPGLPDSRVSNDPHRFLSNSNSAHHPELHSEVAALSNKLITAINNQTNLDDTLNATRHDLDASKERVRQLENATQEHANLLATGVLVKRIDFEDETGKLMAQLASERKQRSVAEKEKRDIELELETLTTALFEEANQMVAAARKERELADRRNEQLRAQINDTELLLASHQEQLADLKSVMQHMSLERDEAETNTSVSLAPSTPPALQTQENAGKFEALHLSPNTPSTYDVPPAPPTSFTHLLHPVLRTDLQSYDDFHSLLQMPHNSLPSSRVTSGSYSGLSVMGLGTLTNRDQPYPTSHVASNGSASSLSTAATYHSSPATPNTPAPTNSSVSSRDGPLSSVSLKETRFYKRVLSEDLEPTLRLDTAPGLSWLARRTVINSMSEGNLIVEPVPTSAKLYAFSCSLCGEHRKGDEYVRTHRFRTSESENAQRYPLCNYCLNRVRASCDFLGFLRMIKDGHWRTEGEEAEKGAWEESVRLRERMFWARMGGGVVPTFVNVRESPRNSVEESKSDPNTVETNHVSEGEKSKSRHPLSRENEDPFHSSENPISIGSKAVSERKGRSEDDETWERARNAAIFEDITHTDDGAAMQLQGNLQESIKAETQTSPTEPLPSKDTPQGNEQRLSITIPGAFDF